MPDGGQIALVGFMGVGKSTVGPLLAAELGYDFVDLDVLLANRTGCPIGEVFAREGESGFRRRERELLAEFAGRPRQVLATGGGVVTVPANIDLLRATGAVVWLAAAPRTILARVGRGYGRPLLAGRDAATTVQRLLAQREPLYRRAADLTVDTTGLRPAQVAGQVAEWYRRMREVEDCGRR